MFLPFLLSEDRYPNTRTKDKNKSGLRNCNSGVCSVDITAVQEEGAWGGRRGGGGDLHLYSGDGGILPQSSG